MRKAYQSDLSDAEWSFLEPLMPLPAATGRPRMHTTREILNAMFYIVRSGCAWRGCCRTTSRRGRPSTITSAPGAWTAPGRGCTQPCASSACGFACLKRDPQPSAGIADSQSVKTTGVGGEGRAATMAAKR